MSIQFARKLRTALLSMAAFLLLSVQVAAQPPKALSDLTSATALRDRCRTMIPKFGVERFEDVICFYGNINAETAGQFFDLVKKDDISIIVMKSGGGDVRYAMDIGDYMVAKQVGLVIDKQCLSSCGNYIFVAAAFKFVLPDSYVCWHGGPGGSEFLGPEATAEQRQAQDAIVARSNTFLDRLHVSRDLFNAWPESWTEEQKAQVATRFWCYGKTKLETRYGVTRILYYENEDNE
ncbi:hypothetical protein GCM10011317_31880 [Niveispirillum cyanobacteriorum]|nr:hypothetical protein GCM10011317_31880 [Niveispirillum cyanobacteriorum]